LSVPTFLTAYPLTRWDRHFMQMAMLVSELSKDRSTKVGCVITTVDHVVLSTGYNGFPRGCFDEGKDLKANQLQFGYRELDKRQAEVEARHERPAKYLWTEHAERNAIFNLARTGGPSLRGARIYVPWFPCADCARAIIQSGISEMVAYMPDCAHPKYGPEFMVSAKMFSEAGLRIRYVERLVEAKAA